jgi:hypothetical protein
MIIPFLPFFASLVGEKAAKPVAIGSAVVLLIALLSLGKCVYDASVVDAYKAKVEAKAAPAREKAADRRAADTITNTKNEKDLHDAVNSAPGGALSPAAHALACERLRKAGRKPAACGPDRGDGAQAPTH